MTIHKDLADSELHEPKHITLATGWASDIAKVILAKGDGSSELRLLKPRELDPAQIQSRMGIWDYNDLATATTPIQLTPVNTFVKMTNDDLGPATIKTYKLQEVADLWLAARD